MAKRIVIKDGDVFRVDLPDGRHAFAQRLRHPLYAFFAPRVTNEQAGAQLIGEHLFSVWIFDAAPKRENWARIGRFPISERLSVNPWFAKQDILNGKITRYRNAPTLQAGYEEVDSTYEEAGQLEIAAVWAAEHVESRLMDHFAGRQNAYLESLRIKRRQVG